MLAKPKASTFIDNLTIDVEDANHYPLYVSLKSEDGKICCKTEKNIVSGKSSVSWEGLNDLPYGVYTLQCAQGDDVVEVRMVKRV